MSKFILHNRVGKWCFALWKCTLHLKPLRFVKGQVIVNFLTDHQLITIIFLISFIF